MKSSTLKNEREVVIHFLEGKKIDDTTNNNCIFHLYIIKHKIVIFIFHIKLTSLYYYMQNQANNIILMKRSIIVYQ